MTEQRDSAVTAAELDAMRVYAHEATKAITSLVGGGSECFGRELHGIFTADLPYCVGRIRDRIDASAEGEINARRALAALRRERDGWKANCQAQLEETHRHMADNAKKDAALREMKGWLTEADIVALSDDTRDTLAALGPAAQGEKKCALHENDCCGADGPDCPYDATELAAMDRSAPAPSAGETQDERAMSIIKRAAEVMKRLSKKTVEQFWQELLEKDDRTSPEEYPDMALITFDEFSGYMAQAVYAAAPAPSAGETLNEGAVAALASYQQGDADGVMVLVSRQAIDECLPHLRAMLVAAPTTGETP